MGIVSLYKQIGRRRSYALVLLAFAVFLFRRNTNRELSMCGDMDNELCPENVQGISCRLNLCPAVVNTGNAIIAIEARFPGNSSCGVLFPKIYVYSDIPAHLLTPQEGPVHLEWAYMERLIWWNMLNYECRVSDPDVAQLFFIPHASTATYHDTGFNRSAARDHFLHIMDHIQARPAFQRSGGTDHIIAFAHDRFTIFMTEQEIEPYQVIQKVPIYLVNMGDIVGPFDVQKNLVVIPPSWFPSRPISDRKPWAQRKYLASFRGTIYPDEPQYSLGLRQKLLQLYGSDPDFAYGDYAPTYSDEMMDAKFCLFIHGWNPWSERLGTIINAGCIPVILANGYALPLYQQLDWRSFSIRIDLEAAKKPGYLKSKLLAIPEEHALKLERKLQHLYPSLIYNQPAKRGDFFYRILWELMKKVPKYKPVANDVWGAS